MDAILPVGTMVAVAVGITWVLLGVGQNVHRWGARQMATLWVVGLLVAGGSAVLASNIPRKREPIVTSCDPAHDRECRPSGPPRLGPAGDTLCCYPGSKLEWISESTPGREALKMGLIGVVMGAVLCLASFTLMRISAAGRLTSRSPPR